MTIIDEMDYVLDGLVKRGIYGRILVDGEIEMVDYLLVTNIYNERDRVRDMFKKVLKFSIQPKKWLWIVDGANDGSEDEIARCAGVYPGRIHCFVLPPKDKGSLLTIGNAYNAAFDGLGLRNEDYDFVCIMDVDANFHPSYFESVSRYFNTPLLNIGAISGQHRNGDKLKMPTGNGKCVRWEIVQNIDKFWELAPDTFLNIKAKAQGYGWKILDTEVGMIDGPLGARILTSKGARHAGWVWYYVYGSWRGAIVRMLHRIYRGRFAMSYIKGFWQNARYDKQRTDDEDVRRYYSGKQRND